MNKTININLGGLFFHIDENAYQKLDRYLNAIKKSLSDDPKGKEEIIKDIELRISELLANKITDQRQVISELDIDEIIKIMGQPEDYLIDEELFNDSEKTSKEHKTISKKLYRDTEDKFLGGVAAGTAHYIGIEPIWSRIFWLIAVFGFGVGFLIYPLLWILLPKAETTAEKLEMVGESVNIDNIERKIRELSENVKSSATTASNKIKDTFANKSKNGLQELLDTIGNIIVVLLKVFVKFIGIIIVLIAAIMLLTIIISMFSVGSVEFLGVESDFVQVPYEIFNSYLPYWLIATLFFIAIAIPFVVLFMLGLKILSNNTKSFNKITSLTLLALWILSILGLIFTGIDITSNYKHEGIYTQTKDVELTKNDTLKISMIANEDYESSKYLRHSGRTKIININGVKKSFSKNVNVKIKKSNTNKTYLKIKKYARGKTYENANENAEKLEYQFDLNNTNLLLNGYFLNEISNSFFNYDVTITLYLPEGATVFLDASTKTYLDDIDNEENMYDRNMAAHYFVMTKNRLRCLDCDFETADEDEFNKTKLKINEEGIDLKIKTEKGKTQIKIDENGIEIK